MCKEFVNSNIEVIDLSENELTIKSLKMLFKFIQKNGNVRRIVVSDNKIRNKNKMKIMREFQKKNVVIEF